MTRNRNRATEEYVARRQAEMLQVKPAELLRMIEGKGGDYYRSDLATPEMEDAYDNYGFSAGGQAQQDVINDMRSYYGLSGSGRSMDVSTMPAELQEQLAYIAAEPKLTAASVPVYEAARVVEPQVGALRKAGERIAQLDDAVQTAIRRKLYGERPDGSYPEGNVAGAKALIASILHGSGPGLSDDALERGLYIAGTRALQAGAVAGAGGGLLQMIGDQNEVGDYGDPGRLHM